MTPVVYIVDDDESIRGTLRNLLEDAGINAETYADGAAFLAACGDDCAGCVLLDVNMPGMSGHDVQRALQQREILIPLVFLSGEGTVRSAVQALQAGAVDFLEKPINGAALLERVRAALAFDRERRCSLEKLREARRRYTRLTPREQEIMGLVVAGMSSKEIARDIGLSPRTVEQHRAHLMLKMGVSSVAELTTLAVHCSVGV